MKDTFETELTDLLTAQREWNTLAIKVYQMKKIGLDTYPVEAEKIFQMEFRMLELDEIIKNAVLPKAFRKG